MTILTTTRAILAADIMSAPTVSIAPSASAAAAWSLMMQTGLRHLVVATDDGCVGVVEDRAVFAEWPMGPLALRRHTVRDLVRPYTTCVRPDTDLRTVAQAMVADGVDAVPVLTDSGQLVGIVTGSDIARAVAIHGVRCEDES